MAKYSLDTESKRQYAVRARAWNKEAANRFENYESLENYIQESYNGSVDADVKELDIRQVNQTLSEFEIVLEDFQKARKYFTGINVSDRGKAGFLPNGELVLSSNYYQKVSVKLLGIGYHEAGHLLELAIIHKDNQMLELEQIYELYKNGIYAKSIVTKAYKRISTNKTMNECRADISDYALKDYSETLADAIKDYYMNGYNASILSRQIIKVLEEEL